MRNAALTFLCVGLWALVVTTACAAESGAGFQLSPAANLYPRYVADPRASRFNIMAIRASSSEIPDSGKSRTGLTVGGRYGLVRWGAPGASGKATQLDVEASILGRFDNEHSLDNLGWDGFYGMGLSWRPADRLCLRAGVHHDSSHVGDEYAERTGRLRIDYTREEVSLGASVELSKRWRAYSEMGWAYHLAGRRTVMWEPTRR